jgi:hypothetical protein
MPESEKSENSTSRIEIDLSLITLGEFAKLDAWAWGQAPFAQALPILQKAVVGGETLLEDLPMDALKDLVVLFRKAMTSLPNEGN